MNLQEFNEQQNNPYYIGYHIVVSSLERNNVYNGLQKSLLLAKIYLSCDDIILYKLNKDSHYEQFNSTPYLSDNYDQFIELLNIRDNDIQEHKCLDFPVYEKDIHRLTILPISFKEYNYRMIIVNNNIKDPEKNVIFMDILSKAFEIILDKMESYKRMVKLSNQDGLTELNNRLAYMIKVEEYNRIKQHITFVYLDLFRLKYINDNYGHLVGDRYIIKTSEILKKYFPSYKFSSKAYTTSKKIETGDNVYRIGGDEFIIISTNKTSEQMEELIKSIVNEVENLDLGIKENPYISLNYGISERYNTETVEELYKTADEKLSIDKKNMYDKLKINRRK